MTSPDLRAIAYLRVSTSGQAETGQSLEAQQRAIGRWCSSNGYHLSHVYQDAGISGGKTTNRPGLHSAIDACCAQAGTALVVYSLSRLARSTKDAIAISEQLNKAGCDLVSLTEKLDTTSASGKMMFRMLAVLGEFERDLVSERTKAVMALKRSKGQRLGRVPFGFRSVNGILEPNQEHRDTITLIQQLRGDGLTLRDIKAELEARGALNTTGGTRWRLNTISDLIKRG
jgi:DNA invertase Pin-like site-specific DNA recombinase